MEEEVNRSRRSIGEDNRGYGHNVLYTSRKLLNT